VQVVIGSTLPFLHNTRGTISPYRSNSFALGHDRYRVRSRCYRGDSYPSCWIEAVSWRRPCRRSLIAEAWVRSRPRRVKMCCGKRGTGIGASFVPLSVSFHHFLLVFILMQLLWRGGEGGAREPSDEVLWCCTSGCIRRSLRQIQGIRPWFVPRKLHTGRELVRLKLISPDVGNSLWLQVVRNISIQTPWAHPNSLQNVRWNGRYITNTEWEFLFLQGCW